MSEFIKGEARTQATLFPELLDDYITEENPVRVIDAFVDNLNLSTLTKYQANHLMVSLFAAPKLAEKYPTYTKEEIAKAMKRKSDFISDKVFKIVKEKGCNDPGIQQLIKRFNVQAKRKPGK